MSTTDTSNSYIPGRIYLRMVGYVATLAMHGINGLHMFNTFSSNEVTDPDVRQFNDDQLKLLTVWNVYLQLFYATVGLSCDVLSLTNQSKDGVLLKRLKIIRDNLFSSVVFPIALSVFSIFWTLFTYERSLILPPSVEKALGHTANHIIHTMILPVALWEVLFRRQQRPKSHALNLVHLNAFIGAYLVVLVTSYIQHGIWVYPILNLLDRTIILYVFLGVAIIIMQLFYFLQWHIIDLVWDSPGKVKKVE